MEEIVSTARWAPDRNLEVDQKEVLQKRMEEARESISQTVTEIKDTVAEQYHSVKDSVAQTFDWREQFRNHPIEWAVGAVCLGLIAGYNTGGAIEDTYPFKRLQKELEKASGTLVDGFSGLGKLLNQELLTEAGSLIPLLSGVVMPVLIKELKDLAGVELADFILGPEAEAKKKRKKKKKKKKKDPEADRNTQEAQPDEA